MRKKNFAIAALLALLILAMPAGPMTGLAGAQNVGAPAPTQQVPQPEQGGVNWPGAGYGVGALLVNILYVPAKLTYAVVGSVVGGLAYVVTAGNEQAANGVWRSALGGDYVVTPQMLAGQQPLNFSGPTGTPPEATAATTPPYTPATASNSSRSVAPIAPIPPSAPQSSNAGAPFDRGAGPANLPSTSIE
ncbi:MAG: hypothetical protein Q7S58_11385 [Candidatus Binatus sp.]|uniref:hypothetical protein n=1 Tax=Candidatus Binatus sp. TaxID=2811406 RepID=UPI00271F939C|nr:hypothetical protein [Candidatus Binatus sp.]MDO8432999.1 hypothetical protein [Candidatus Binatus sp.]